jgi:hypothetical protein
MVRCPNCGYHLDELSEGRDIPFDRCPACSASLSSSPSHANAPSESQAFILPADQGDHDHVTSPKMQSSASAGMEVLSEETDALVCLDERPMMQEMIVSEPGKQEEVALDEEVLPTPEERAEATLRSLRDKGFVIHEDAHGLRLSGISTRGNKGMSQLSPFDIVRLAADLEGGLLPMDQRKRCPKCDAVVAPGDKRCQWCSEPLS